MNGFKNVDDFIGDVSVKNMRCSMEVLFLETGKLRARLGKQAHLLDEETITVPYGKAECDKIDLESMQLWYSADKNRILYQYKDGDITFKLKSLTRN
jgi:hypothetical protein